MKYSLYVSYRSLVSCRWGKYRFVDTFDSYSAADSYCDMIAANHLSGTVRFKIL